MPRQMLAVISDQRATPGAAEEIEILCQRGPADRRARERMENCGSQIHQKAMAESTVGTIQGSRMMAQNALEGQVVVEQEREPEPKTEFPNRCDRGR